VVGQESRPAPGVSTVCVPRSKPCSP